MVGGKRKHNYHSNAKYRKKQKYCLDTGMQGFLCTCNNKERECVREAYNVLNDYGDKLFGEEKVVKSPDEDDVGKDTEIEDELEKEVNQLKTSTQRGERRFQLVESGANCCIFIKAKIPDPVKLAASIMEDVKVTKTQKTRYLMRLLPVEVTCKAYLDTIKKAADSLFDKYFKCEPTTFAIVYNKRNNDSLLRDEVITSLALLVQDKNILHKVDLRQAHLTIVVEVIKSICCLSVVPDYFDYCKYNLMQLSKKEDNDNAEKTLISEATIGNGSKTEADEKTLDKCDKEDKSSLKSSEEEKTQEESVGSEETSADCEKKIELVGLDVISSNDASNVEKT